MKKFTILIALILCLTISGVYATWTYQGGEIEARHQHFNVYMGALDNDEAKGLLQIVTNALSIKINDDEGGANGQGDYIAEAALDGFIEFVFTPKANATDAVREQGIDLVFELMQKTPYIFDGEEVFTIENGTGELGKGQKITAETVDEISPYNTNLSNYIGSFYYCIKAADLEDMITTDLYLPTYDDYVEMKNILNTSNSHIGIEISEK